ncbi:MAG TPA: helix-turn-helix transcriptional regulator [Myxococcota bacterium]|nr:helix-turn-helix transcriptional regulator [Myxococcota bacterium]
MTRSRPPFARLLRQWRDQRAYSQLALAMEAGISTRHLSFLENGRSAPSREMVLRLAAALDVPLRERNALLAAAGFASVYRESKLDAPEMAMLRRVIDFVLERHAPFPAVLIDRYWNLLGANDAAPRLLGRFARASEPWIQQPINLLRLTLHPEALQPHIVNFEEVATELLTGLHRRVSQDGEDPECGALLAELTALPGIPAAGVVPDLSRSPNPAIPLHLKGGDLELRLFTFVTQIAAPQDVMLDGLRIESFMPADPASEAAIRELAAGP